MSDSYICICMCILDKYYILIMVAINGRISKITVHSLLWFLPESPWATFEGVAEGGCSADTQYLWDQEETCGQNLKHSYGEWSGSEQITSAFENNSHF